MNSVGPSPPSCRDGYPTSSGASEGKGTWNQADRIALSWTDRSRNTRAIILYPLRCHYDMTWLHFQEKIRNRVYTTPQRALSQFQTALFFFLSKETILRNTFCIPPLSHSLNLQSMWPYFMPLVILGLILFCCLSFKTDE